jgi:hypothetical protein
VEGEWKYNGGRGEHVEGTLYVCTKLLQWNPLILLMHANSKIKEKFKNTNTNERKYKDRAVDDIPSLRVYLLG